MQESELFVLEDHSEANDQKRADHGNKMEYGGAMSKGEIVKNLMMLLHVEMIAKSKSSVLKVWGLKSGIFGAALDYNCSAV